MWAGGRGPPRRGGTLGGFTAALVSGVHPVLLTRSLGSDNKDQS
jgi:hypothetical protein